MLLTGKASKDFIKWLHFKHNLQPYNLFNEIIQYSLIIEWFDSVGIYINQGLSFKKSNKFKCDIYIDVIDSILGQCLTFKGKFENNDKSKTIKQAIEKANEIYNSK